MSIVTRPPSNPNIDMDIYAISKDAFILYV